MRGPRPTAAAAVAIFVFAATTAFSLDDGACNAVAHGETLGHMCRPSSSTASSSTRPSPPCCRAIFAVVEEGGIRCLCRVADSPYMIVDGFGRSYLISAFLDCGGELPAGARANTACLDSDLPPEMIAPPAPALPPPPPQLASPPPPPIRKEDPVLPSLNVAPWYAPHVMKAIYIGGGLIGGFVLLGGLFYCIHKGGRVGAAASSLLASLVAMGWCLIGGRGRRTPSPPHRTPFGPTSTSGNSPPTPRLRAPHLTSDCEAAGSPVSRQR